MALPEPIPIEPAPGEPGGTVLRFPWQGPQVPQALPLNPADWQAKLPDWLPSPDETSIYFGKYVYPVWEDVYNFATGLFDSGTSISDLLDIKTAQVLQESAHRAIGSSIKAFSGMIDNAVAQEQYDVNAVQSSVLAMGDALALLNNLQDAQIKFLQNEIQYIVKVAVPTIRAEILQAKLDAEHVAAYDALANRQWAIDNIFRPLEEQLGQERAKAKAYTDGRVNEAENISHVLNNAEHAAMLGTTAAIAAKLAPLIAESENCVKDMCATMGPKTDLGKFLKAFKIAEWAALIAELANLRASGLDGLLADVEGWAKTAINDFESAFLSGGKTLGETIAAI